MTNIIFMPDDRTLVHLETTMTILEIVQAVDSGSWHPPQPYAGLVAAGVVTMRAVRQGRRIVIVAVTPLSPQEDQQLPYKTRHLSPRQAQVLQGLFNGLTTKEIAFKLGIKPRTVKMHVAALKNRFNANTRAQSVGIAANLGLYPGQEDKAG